MTQIRELLNEKIINEKILNEKSILWAINGVDLPNIAMILVNNDIHHLISIIGLETDEGLELRYIFAIPNDENSNNESKLVLIVILENERELIPSIQNLFPVAVFHEREAYDMLGIKFSPKEKINRILLPDPFPEDIFPLRKKYDYHQLREIIKNSSANQILPSGTEPIKERADYSIVIGPQHPTHKEPIRFTFHISGETIEDVDVRVGFNHRGIEKAFEARTWNQNLYLAERICGICSNAHQLCMSETVEKIVGISIPERAKYIRILISELERIHSHLLWYGVLAHDAGFDTLFHIVWRDREIIMDELERISGNRVNYSLLSLGGVRRDINTEIINKIKANLKILRKKVFQHQKMLENETSFIKRLENVAPLSYKDARHFSAVGPTLRASGVKIDTRKVDPSPSSYADIPFDVIIGSKGDVYDTMHVRILETYEAIDIALYVLENLPQGDIETKFPNKVQPGEAITRVEAPRGENLHFARSTGGLGPDRYRVRAPTLQNLPSLVYRLRGSQVADIPVTIRAIDPCIGCMERVAFVKPSGKTFEIDGSQLIKRANLAYKNRGKIF